jgi:amphiphysin
MYVPSKLSSLTTTDKFQEFKVADDHLRETLPPIIAAAFSILPHLLAVQIMIQNTLLAQSYTILHNYCDEASFQSPPPPMEEVIATWERDFKPIQKEVESINCIARGKAIHQSMSLGDDASGRKNSSITGLNVRNGFANRRASSQGMLSSGAASPNPQARVMRIPSSNSIPVVSPPAPEPSPSLEPDYGSHFTPASSYSSHSPAGPSGDYFQRGVGQKKKPPPPPPKRIGSQSLFAVALYAFAGEGQGDLSFQEGDRIKVLKKTDSTDDWWEGELRGVKGSFPANYCKLA